MTDTSGTLSVIDTARLSVIAGIPLDPGGTAGDIDVSADGRRGHVTRRGSGTVAVLDAITPSVAATIPVQSAPNGVAVTPDGRHVHVTSEGATRCRSSTRGRTP